MLRHLFYKLLFIYKNRKTILDLPMSRPAPKKPDNMEALDQQCEYIGLTLAWSLENQQFNHFFPSH